MHRAQLSVYQRIELAAAKRALRLPATAVRLLSRRPAVVDGNTLDPRAQYMFLLTKLRPVALWSMSPAAARLEFASVAELLQTDAPPVPRIVNMAIAGPDGSARIPIRVYWPVREAEKLPILVYYHGGGFVVGDLDTHDPLCRYLCRTANCIVLAVDYRRAPEHPFPAAVEDAYTAFRWARSNATHLGADPERVAIGGDSAGGNLSAAVSGMALDAGVPLPLFQLLLYPGVDVLHPGREHPYLQEGYGLDRATLDWFTGCYLQRDDDSRDQRASPALRSPLDGLPATILVTAAFDLLCAEGNAYAADLKRAGVPVDLTCFHDLPHGFANMTILPRAKSAMDEICAKARVAFAHRRNVLKRGAA